MKPAPNHTQLSRDTQTQSLTGVAMPILLIIFHILSRKLHSDVANARRNDAWVMQMTGHPTR